MGVAGALPLSRLIAALGAGLVALAVTTAHAQGTVRFQAGGPGVEIVDGTGKVIATVPAPGGVRDLLVRGSVLYVARGTTGVDVVDVSDLAAPRVVRTIADGHAIARIEEKWAQLLLYRLGGGRALVYDSADPLRPLPDAANAPSSQPTSQPASQPGSIVVIPRASVPALVVPPPRRVVERPAPAPDPEVRRRRLPSDRTGWDGLSRLYFKLTPAWNFGCYVFSGAWVDLGFEHTTRSGFLIGAELGVSAAACYGFTAQARVGYGGENGSVAIALASGYPFYYTYPRVGPRFRIGSLAGAHAELWLNWSPMLLGPIPTDGEFRLSIPTTEVWRFLLVLGGNYLPMLGPYFLLGGQRTLYGSGLRDSGVISFGFGMNFSLIWIPIPGPYLHIGYEKRF